MHRGKQTQGMSQIPRVSCKPVNRIVMSVDFGCTFNRIRETILRKSWSPKLGKGGGITERKYSGIYIQWVLPIHFAVCLERYDRNMAIWLYGLWSKRGDWWLSGLDWIPLRLLWLLQHLKLNPFSMLFRSPSWHPEWIIELSYSFSIVKLFNYFSHWLFNAFPACQAGGPTCVMNRKGAGASGDVFITRTHKTPTQILQHKYRKT